jgi:hypothetical protein
MFDPEDRYIGEICCAEWLGCVEEPRLNQKRRMCERAQKFCKKYASAMGKWMSEAAEPQYTRTTFDHLISIFQIGHIDIQLPLGNKNG